MEKYDKRRAMYLECGDFNNITFSNYNGPHDTIYEKRMFAGAKILKNVYVNVDDNYTLCMIQMADPIKIYFKMETVNSITNDYRSNEGIVTLSATSEGIGFGGIETMDSIKTINQVEYIVSFDTILNSIKG